MENIKFSINMMTAMKKMSVRELAEACNINVDHLRNVSSGQVRMSADDLLKLSAFTGIPCEKIQICYKEE